MELDRLPYMLALAAGVTAVALLPLTLLKPGRVLLTPTGELIINPVSVRGLGLLLAADFGTVVGLHLALSLRRPRPSLLPINVGLSLISACSFVVGALGGWLLLDPWRPSADLVFPVPKPNAIDLAGFAVAALSLAARLAFAKTYARHWETTAEGRPLPERPQSLGERLQNGAFMAVVLGTLGWIAGALGCVLVAAALGVPPGWKGLVVLWGGLPISLGVQVWSVRQGLEGKITPGRGFFRGTGGR